MLSRAEIEKVLELIFQDMQKAGMATQDMIKNKDEILSAVKDSLLENDNQLTWQDLRTDAVQKKLMGTIVNTALNGPDKEGHFTCTKENNEFMKELDKEKDEKQKMDPKLEKKMQAMLFVKMSLDQIANSKDKQLIANFLNPFVKELTMKKDHPKKDEMENGLMDVAKELDKQVENTILAENAGMDTRNAGSIQKPIMGTIFGNLSGMTNQSAADPNSLSALVLDITFNAGQYDAQGKENNSRMAGLLSGALESVANTMASAATTPTLDKH